MTLKGCEKMGFNIYEQSQNFLNQLKSNKKSKYTIKNYSVTYNQLVNFVADSLGKTEVDEAEFKDSVKQFVTNLSEEDFSGATINAKRTHIRRLIEFLYKEGYIELDFGGEIQSVSQIRGEEPAVLLPEEIQRIENVLIKEIEEARGYDIYLASRKLFLFETFLWTGARISEVAHLRWRDINMDKKEITLYGKRNKARTLPLIRDYQIEIYNYKDTLNKLEEKLKIEGVKETYYIFKSDYGIKNEDNKGNKEKHVSTRYIYNVLKDVFEKAKVNEDITPHSLRHTFASYCIMNGVSIPAVSSYLGHENARITWENYAHIISKKQMREEMRKLRFA